MSVDSILVATDLSSHGDRPLDRAVALAQQWDAKLTVLHVLRQRASGNQKTREDLAHDRVLAVLPESQAGVEILIRAGAAPETIVRTAEDAGAGLIVTGIARIDSIGDFFLGTAVDRIVRHTGIPVLVVKQRPKKSYDKLVIATDLSTCSRAALLVAADMFPKAELHLVHPYHVAYEAWLKSEATRREVRDTAQGELDMFVRAPELSDALRRRIRPFLGYGDSAEAVAKALRDTGADLLVVGTRRRRLFGGGLQSLLGFVPSDTLMIQSTWSAPANRRKDSIPSIRVAWKSIPARKPATRSDRLLDGSI